MNFSNFQFHTKINAGISAAGFTTPTPIQEKAIPLVMQGEDLIGLAQTGTGKTAAFALPILNRFVTNDNGNGRPPIRTSVRDKRHVSIRSRVNSKKKARIRALIIAPTRELAEQIQNDIESLSIETRISSLTLYGGVGLGPQIQKLNKGAEIIVACPGRLLDHINRGNVDLSALEVLILDEADQMLDMGFMPDIRRILRNLPTNRQTLLFSATMPKEIKQLAKEILQKPVTVQIGNPAPADTVSHTHFPVTQNGKKPLLLKLLKDTQIGSVLIFTRTKHRARHLSDVLSRQGYASASLQGNLSQGRRRAAIDGFRTGKVQILVATDIAARGIDVSAITHVINYDVPNTAEAYIHRIGRTGRAMQRGEAFNFVTHDDHSVVKSIERLLGASVTEKVLQDFSDQPPLTVTNDTNKKTKPKSYRKYRGQRP